MIVYLGNKETFREDILKECGHLAHQSSQGSSENPVAAASACRSKLQNTPTAPISSAFLSDLLARHSPQDGGGGAFAVQNSSLSPNRCNGSDGYLAWLDRVLQVRETANTTLEGANYEFKVCESVTELNQWQNAKATPAFCLDFMNAAN